MSVYGLKFPKTPRKTALYEAEEWYQNLLAEKLCMPYAAIQRSNFGQYDMAVHYLTSILEEARAIEKVAVFNIDHMGQIMFSGKDASALLNRVLPADIENMQIGQCKYTLLLNENGTVRDDMIVMKQAVDSFILVINAGHDITDKEIVEGVEIEFLSDADFIMQHKREHEIVFVKNISEKFVKIDIQGPFSYKVITDIFGKDVLKNRSNPEKNMAFFSFNEVVLSCSHCPQTSDMEKNNKTPSTYFFSRTGYTNRWGWEIFVPIEHAVCRFKQIVLKAFEYGGLLVGLGGRDENRISAGNVGLPLMGSEYDGFHTPTNAPLIDAAIDWNKGDFIGREALLKEKEKNITKKMVIIVAEGNIVNNGVYLSGERLGSVTSCIISPNVPLEKRLFIGSSRKNVNDENGTAAIALAWLYKDPFVENNDQPIRIKVELFREKDGQVVGKPVLGYISSDGVNPATAPKPLKNIENL